MRASVALRAGPSGQRAGYTFIELAVVLTLVVIVVSITMPQFTRMVADTNVGSCARRFAGEVLYLRNLAAKKARTFYINIDFATNSYSVVTRQSLSEVELPEDFEYTTDYEYLEALEQAAYQPYADEFVGAINLRRQVQFLDVTLADGTVVSEGMVKIAFYSNGKADKAAVHFTNPKDDFYTVEIRPYTVRPRTYEDYTELQEEIDLGYEEEEEEEYDDE